MCPVSSDQLLRAPGYGPPWIVLSSWGKTPLYGSPGGGGAGCSMSGRKETPSYGSPGGRKETPSYGSPRGLVGSFEGGGIGLGVVRRSVCG